MKKTAAAISSWREVIVDWENASPEDRFAEAERRIEEARCKNETYLDLGDLGLHELPQSLGNLESLQELFLGEEFRREDGEIRQAYGRAAATYSDFGPAVLLPNLRLLSLSSCPALTNGLAPIGQFTGIQNIRFCSFPNLADNVSALSPLSNLQSISLINCTSLTGDLSPLARLSNLQDLSLINCPALTGDLLPLAKLSNLRLLHLSTCPSIASDLTPLVQLSNLRSLSLSYCRALTGDLVPLARLPSLEDLSLYSCNHLVGDLGPLSELSNLLYLSLASCRTLTGNLAPLAPLANLQYLSLSSCPALSGNLEPLSQLASLRILTLDSCPALTDECPPFPILTNLELLRVFDCGGIRLKPEICTSYLLDIRNLSAFYCNSMEGVPPEQLSTSWDDNCLPRLRSYLADLKAGKTEETEVKLILLGNGRVGKTQLCRRLRNEEFKGDSESTHGVELWRQAFELTTARFKSTFFANWWDFGGQEIYHSTHSLFLRSRAIFLILWTPELENSEEFQENGIPLRNQHLAYWLDYVRSLAGPGSPLIIVQSKCESFAARRDLPVLPEGFDFVEVCAFGAKNDFGIENLGTNLREAIRYLGEKHGPLLIGTGRAALRERLFAMRDADQLRPADQRQHRTLDFATFEKLCAEAGGISSAEHALDYLHQTGVVFHQRGLFSDRIVLDQSWALDAVYAVFDRARTWDRLRENGRFTRRDLELLCWQDKPRGEQELLLGLMQSCGICFVYEHDWKNEEHTYLAPDLLPDLERVRKQLFAWREDAEQIGLGLEYRFLHHALLRGLISQIGGKVGENAVYWKYGLWLRTRNGTQLLVRQESLSSADRPGAGRLWISAQGPESASLVGQIREKAEKLPVVEKPEELLRLSGATVRRSALESAIDGKVHTVDGKVVNVRPFVSFWNGRRAESEPATEELKFMIDAAPLEKKPLKVFYSYSHKDEKFRDELAKHLSLLERQKLLETWHDRALDAGSEWDDEIRRKLQEADIILLLVSADFLDSEYIWDKELAPALVRHERKEARVIPVILDHCDWHSAPFSKLQALPRDAKPIATWSNRAEAYTAISQELRRLASAR